MIHNPSDREGSSKGFPFFAPNPPVFAYKVQYTRWGKVWNVLYETVHELILNLQTFSDSDLVTFLENPDRQEFITIPLSQFKLSVASTLLDPPREKIELLYLRLIVTNHHSSRIGDKGILLKHDQKLRNHIATQRGGVDWHLALERGRTILYLKSRRLSPVFLVGFLVNLNHETVIDLNHVNIPKQVGPLNLINDALGIYLRKRAVRFYQYSPFPEAPNDVIVPTNLTPLLSRIINHFLKLKS